MMWYSYKWSISSLERGHAFCVWIGDEALFYTTAAKQKFVSNPQSPTRSLLHEKAFQRPKGIGGL